MTDTPRRTLADLALSLIEALDRCKPHIDGAFTMAHVHGFTFAGPTYGEELEALRAALRDEPRPLSADEWKRESEALVDETRQSERGIDRTRSYGLSEPRPSAEPLNIPRWKCRQCGCLWRDNLDGTVSLFNAEQKSCWDCEALTGPETCEVSWFKAYPHADTRVEGDD